MKDSSNLNPSRVPSLPPDTLSADDPFSSPSADMPSGGLLEYWRIIQRRKTTVIVIIAIGMLAGFLYTLPQTPIYQARTVIEIQSLNEDFLNMKDVDPDSHAPSWDPSIDLQTQVRILQSSSLLSRVSQKVAAEANQLNPAPMRVQAWRKILHLPEKTGTANISTNIGVAVSNLKVRSEANTRLIDIVCDSPDPNIAAAYANTLASEFIEQSLEARWQTTQHTGEFLSNQMQDLKVKLERSEDEMQAYARDTNLVITDEKNNAVDQKLNQVQEELSKAQAERIDHQSRYELARRAPADSLAEIIDDGSLKDMQSRLMDLRRQYAELSSTLTPANPKAQKIQAQIASLEAAREQQRNNILGRINNDFEAAQRRENLLAADYASTAKIVAAGADKITHYNTLKREVDTNRQLSDSIFQRVKEASIASALRASNIHVVDPAVIPKAPYKPSILVNTLIGLIAGVLLGVVSVVFMERSDRTIQEPGDITFYLGTPELGIIPSYSGNQNRARWPLTVKNPLKAANGSDVALTTLGSKPSPIAESFRATLTSIMFSGERGVHPQVLVVTSATPNEGKTTLSTNLAVALAEIHKRVLLIDADLRRPNIHRFFDLTKDTGMVDLLRRGVPIAAPLNGHVRPSGVENLYIMTSGRTVDGDPTLLHSSRLAELIELVRQDYDLVVIDTPPMLNIADARIIARQADGVILVVRANVTSRDSIKDAYRRFCEDGTRVIGAVLNDWNPKKSSRYSYYSYEKYKHYYGESKGNN